MIDWSYVRLFLEATLSLSFLGLFKNDQYRIQLFQIMLTAIHAWLYNIYYHKHLNYG